MTQIEKMLNNIEEIREYLLSIKGHGESMGTNDDKSPKPQPDTFPEIKLKNNKDFEDLKLLLESDQWPEAVPQSFICDRHSEKDKIERAESIVDLMCPSMNKKSFLDFGCGEGHTIEASIKNGAKKSIGYDIVQFGELEWENEKKILITTDFKKVLESAPYDVILLYDVLDHCKSPIETMNQVKQVSHKNTEIILRCHPWCSRHGNHQYRNINKSFLHLVFTKEELELLGCDSIFTKQVIHPLKSYRNWLRSFQIIEEHIIKTPVEDFFKKNDLITCRIKKHWGSESSNKDFNYKNKFPEFQLSQDFIDYKVKIK